MATLLVTGGAGFIGSCYVLARCAAGDTVVNLDKLTYSGNLGNLDNAIIAQMGTADMRVPIQYAITYPQRVKSPGESLDLIKLGKLTFSEPDTDTFQALSLAESALHAGGTAPTILNAANEVAVQKFLEDKLTFAGITEYVKDILNKTPVIKNPSIEQIFETDERIRRDYGRK